MQTPVSYVFKVQPLDWKEWLACIAIGVGVIPYSWAVRLLVRGLIACGFTGDNLMQCLRGRRVRPEQ
jgi:Ca2+-transporting ATPase